MPKPAKSSVLPAANTSVPNPLPAAVPPRPTDVHLEAHDDSDPPATVQEVGEPGNGVSFSDTPPNNEDFHIGVENQGVSSGPKRRAKLPDEQIASIKERIAQLEKNVYKRMDRMQGTMQYLAKCVEEFNENFATIMEVVKDQRVRTLAETDDFEVVFPLTTKEEVDKYIEEDPQMVKLIDRCVRALINQLYIV